MPQPAHLPDRPWWLYLIRMANGNLYCGITTDLNRRFQEHSANNSKTAKALRNKGPLQLCFSYQTSNKRQALQLEYQLKQWPKARKEQLINGQLSPATLVQQLNSRT